mgnify:CR=1 FL=1
MTKYTVLRSYLTVECHQVEAEDVDQAKDLALEGAYFHKTFEGDYDDEITITEGWE